MSVKKRLCHTSNEKKARAKARGLLAEEEAEIARIAEESEMVTIPLAIKAYEHTHLPRLKPATEKDYKKYLPFIETHFQTVRFVARIDEASIRHFKKKLDRDKSTRTVKMYISVLSSLLSFCAEEGAIPRNPALGLALRMGAIKIRKRIFTAHEQHALLFTTDGILKTLCALCLQGGMRPWAEATKVHRDNVDFEKRLILLTDTKNGSDRLLPMTKHMEEQIREQGFHPVTGWLFAHENGERIKSLYIDFKRFCDRNCIPDAQAKDMRKTYGTNKRAIKVPDSTRTSIMGHHSEEFNAKVYAFAQGDELRAAADALDAFHKSHKGTNKEQERLIDNMETG